ncbi:restriction endonuclease subunit S [Epilithonimonas vandammei]|uniref:restriction endonuclease subunit S n=1 Tax=Epilithonimonas vandammei TaxID=2487072 RepID=UPI0028AD6908|nr:restriction endonuclease subunit S [Epilithonimonas vandammei]
MSMKNDVLIPSSWRNERIKNIGTVNGRVGWKALKAAEYVENGYFFLSTPNIKDNEIDFINVNYITAERYFESPEIMLQENDVLLVKDGSTLGIVNFIRHLPSEGTVNSSIAVLRFKNENAHFIYYFLKSNLIQEVIQLKKDGMGVPHLFQKDINNFEIFLPSFSEQTTIAQYLDRKTKAVDRKTALLQQKIETYKKLRKAIINKAVTKGLEDKMELKESEIDWIGKIPKHWEVKRFKDVVKKYTTGGTPSTSNTSFFEGKNTWICIGDLSDEKYIGKSAIGLSDEAIITANILKTPKGSLLYSFKLSIGKMAFVTKDVYTNEAIISIFPNHIIELEYFYYMLPIFMELAATENIYGAKMLNQKLITNALLIYPPINEQRKIAAYLNQKTATIDKIVENLQTQITTLQHFRKVLINDAVTGKIKVV